MDYNLIRKKTIKRLGNSVADLPLPLIDEIRNLRSIKEICNRINVMHIMYTLSQVPTNLENYNNLIFENSLQESLTVEESNILLEQHSLDEQTILNFSWYKESIKSLLWCISYVKILNSSFNEDFLSNYYELMPPEVSFEQFLTKAKIRPLYEIAEELDYLFCYHWLNKKALSINNKKWSVLIERRKSLQWVCYPNEIWNEVSIDT